MRFEDLDYAVDANIATIALNRQPLWRMLDADHPLEAHHLESRAIAATVAMADAREGVATFLEKRLPHFTGKVSDTDFSKTWWSKA